MKKLIKSVSIAKKNMNINKSMYLYKVNLLMTIKLHNSLL